METLSRTLSDISLELINQETLSLTTSKNNISPISEVEDAKCEGCGMCEECTPEGCEREMEKNGGKLEEALCAHVYTCARFNRLGRAYPVLCQAEAMREMLKKNRDKSLSPRDKSSTSQNKSGIVRSSSCIPEYYKGN
ncbi:hypothetical protein F511_21607 [Dorcoceras hygrometricum]|uniref:4Fe-4S ferredoxin-type domain-containing protein n=1 Tax=Dorcoceras hygrometricum TaxID=472368 RepID=A0A2Z7AZQ5_9LAMI|nr:hypothetical protein F511_21607 [Dorcoceras hygrometricum]